MFKPHRESSAAGFEDGQTSTEYLSPATSDARDVGLIIKSILTTSGRQNPGNPSRPEITQPPILTRHGVTLRPVPVTTMRITINNGITSTLELANYQYMFGSFTLTVGLPVTVDGVVVALRTDSDGSAVLIADDTTTTFSALLQGYQTAQQMNTVNALSISTIIVEGTTKYVFAGQTLSPDQPVTVGDTPISIVVVGNSTILVVGDATTTLHGGLVTEAVTELGPSTAATPEVATSNDIARPASTSAKAAAGRSKVVGRLLTTVAALTTFIWTLY
ncbi:hypothetical protein N0V83_005665 [Neocucurbitaria cava]|uniref:Uncharacterized protein n=1 Tax=Neocucurbitaria cava TaxID=798079 RepID=A0A9W8Y9B0_9PLEO|nr:hypothetical protein N0V83_005665 [Neocucurbitaria cava]